MCCPATSTGRLRRGTAAPAGPGTRGAAAWLPRVLAEWVLGVRPSWDGLRFDPCLPASWSRARMVRPWRGATLEVDIERASGAEPGIAVAVDGSPLSRNLMPPVTPGRRYRVEVRFR